VSTFAASTSTHPRILTLWRIPNPSPSPRTPYYSVPLLDSTIMVSLAHRPPQNIRECIDFVIGRRDARMAHTVIREHEHDERIPAEVFASFWEQYDECVSLP
jgi:hypothetical protein